MRILLCVDLSNQVYRAAAANPRLTYHTTFTGGLYGFFMLLGKMARDTGATDIAFCRDSKPYLRSKEYPEYKQLRKKHADEDLVRAFTQSMKLVLDTLDEIGCQVWEVPGFESDDLIAHTTTYRHRFERIYAASKDSDLYQLLVHDNFRIYRKGMEDLVSRESLAKTLDLTPQEFTLATALSGTHNCVEGIPRVGDVLARRAVKDPAKMREMRERWGDLIDRNMRLIQLPHPNFPTSARIPRHEPFSKKRLYRSLGRYDIEVTPAMVDAFDQLYQPKE